MAVSFLLKYFEDVFNECVYSTEYQKQFFDRERLGILF